VTWRDKGAARMFNHQPATIASERNSLPRPANSATRAAHDRDLTIGMIVSTWPRLSQTFVLREVLGLERLGLRVRIFSIKVPTGVPVHTEVAQVRAPVTYLGHSAVREGPS